MKPRTKKATPGKSKDEETTKPAIQTLEPSVQNPPHVFILPKDVSSESRVITLPQPATSTSSRYLVCPQKGCYEFTRMAGPKKACRSWLLASERKDGTTDSQGDGEVDSEGYVLQKPDLMVATPIDPLFLILPALIQDTTETGGMKMHLSASDYITKLQDSSAHFKQLLGNNDSSNNLDNILESRISCVCDPLDTGDEILYRLSQPKLLAELVAKAKRMVEKGLPASMEERFIKQALAAPVLSVRREDSTISLIEDKNSSVSGTEDENASAPTSQESQASSVTNASDSTAPTSVSSAPAEDPSRASEEVTNLLRIRTALDFLTHSYIPPTIRSSLESLTRTTTCPVNFSPLDKHLAYLEGLKKEAQALRSLSENISRKRSAMDDDDAMEKAEAKKRKKEEEELRKKNMSRGVQQLKKADTSGMKKLSSFFTAKAGVKKS